MKLTEIEISALTAAAEIADDRLAYDEGSFDANDRAAVALALEVVERLHNDSQENDQ